MDLHLPKFNIFSHITAYSKSSWFNLLAYNTDTLFLDTDLTLVQLYVIHYFPLAIIFLFPSGLIV